MIKSYVYDLPFVTTIEVLVAVWLRSPAFGQALTRAFCAVRIRSPVSDRHWLAPLAPCATFSQSSDSLLCHQGNRSIPSFVLFTDSEYLIGDALRHPGNIAFDAIGKFSGPKDGVFPRRQVMPSLRAPNIWLETHCESREHRVDASQWAGSYSGLEWLRYWRFRIITEMTTRIKFRYSASCLFDSGYMFMLSVSARPVLTVNTVHASIVKAWHKYAMESL